MRSFLFLIAVLNLIVLAGIFKVFREMRNGTYDEAELEARLQARGLMYRSAQGLTGVPGRAPRCGALPALVR